MAKLDLPDEVWKSVKTALEDYIRFGPGDFDQEYIPDEHLEQAVKEIDKVIS